jgi:glycosyltransferase involved in cell wall biosynthesis
MSMPKLLIVIARLNVGGTARYVGALTKSMQSNGYEVLVATGFTQGAEVEDQIVNSIPLIRIRSLGRAFSPSRDIRARHELKKLIKKFSPDLIYTHTFKAGALVRSLKLEVPVIHAFHGHLIYEPELSGIKIKIVMKIERRLAKRAKYLVTVGKRVSKELINARVGTPRQFISIAPGVSALDLEDEDRAREKLGLLDEKRPIIVWFARVVEVKNPFKAVELARQIPQARFILAGGGDLLEEIRSIAPSNLSVLGWQDARVIWSVADLAISTSSNEGIPIALIEAQLAGVPVVAVDVGSIEEIVENGRTGYLHEECSKEFRNSVVKLIQDPALLQTFGVEARRQAIKKFSIERFTQDHLKLFSSVL